MKPLEDIFELTDSILPRGAVKVVFFCEVEDNAHEIFYYATFPDNLIKQCYDLAEQGEVDEVELDECFDKMADFIRKTPSYASDSRNVVTIIIEGSNEKVNIENVSKEVSLYSIKKNWKRSNL